MAVNAMVKVSFLCVDHRKEGEENDYEPDCVLDPDVIVFRQQGNRQSVRFPVWDYGTHLGGWDSGRIRTDAASAHRGNCYLQQGGCSVCCGVSSPLSVM